MPQLDPSTYTSQIFWLLVSFLLLLTIMRFVIVPRIQGIIEERRYNIKNYINKAERLQEQAVLSLDKYNKTIKNAEKQVQEASQAAEAEVENFIKEKTAETFRILNQNLEENEGILAKEKEAAFNEAIKAANDISWVMLNKIGIHGIKQEEIAEFVSMEKEKING